MSDGKLCSRCGQRPKLPSHYSYCRLCLTEYGRAWNERNPEKTKEYSRRYRLSGKGKVVNRRYNLRKFGLTIKDYDAILDQQGGGCAACGSKNHDGRGNRLAVDHDHETNTVRGLLCVKCNRALGLVNDDPQILRALAEYMEKRKERHAKDNG